MDNLHPWLAKGIYALVVAGLLGGGTTVLKNSTDVAVLQSDQTRIETAHAHSEASLDKRLDRMEGKIDKLIERELAK